MVIEGKGKILRILILSSEVWSDSINGNNVISNWFEGMDADFANIYCSPGTPDNKCCNTYFQVTDWMMFRSMPGWKKAGRRLDQQVAVGELRNERDCNDDIKTAIDRAEEEPEKLYKFLKSISGDFLRWAREVIWILGKYDKTEMKRFMDDFSPDIIFSLRMASCKMLRLEKIVSGMSEATLVAFTGDDEYSLRQYKFSPFFWINRFMVRRRLREMVKRYRIYYTLSQEQLEDYKERFGCNMKLLQKCGELRADELQHTVSNHPVEIIYAGKLYMKRWKALADISDCIRRINVDGVRMVLRIYTKDNITGKQRKRLDDRKNSFIMKPVSQERLREIYQRADIALHVESQQLSQKLATRLSFSTKIIDCLFSGCAVIAYCWRKQSGWTYLKREDAAICVDNKEDLYKQLSAIAHDESIIARYAEKARQCCIRNHQKKHVQQDLLADFERLLQETV